jgi:hypothetical protein
MVVVAVGLTANYCINYLMDCINGLNGFAVV